MQNLVIFIEPSEYAYDISLRDVNKFLNRFSIDEDAAFELSAVHYLKKSSRYCKLVGISKGRENTR